MNSYTSSPVEVEEVADLLQLRGAVATVLGAPKASRDASLAHPAGLLMPDQVLAVALSSSSSGHQQAMLARVGGTVWESVGERKDS